MSLYPHVPPKREPLFPHKQPSYSKEEEKPLEFLNGYAVPLKERAVIEDRTRKLLLAEINSEWASSRELLKAIEKKQRVYIDMEWALHVILDGLLPEGKVGQATFYGSVASWWNNQPLSCPKCGSWQVNQFFTEGGILIYNHCEKCDHKWGGWEKPPAIPKAELYRTTKGFEEDAALRTDLETKQGYKLYAVFETPEVMLEEASKLVGQDVKFVKHISTTNVPTWEIYAKPAIPKAPVTPEVTKATKLARDYWDANLENNPLRLGDKDTGAGAFLARKIENAGDILREMGKDFSDGGYVAEKIGAIRRDLNVIDWSAQLSSGEWERLVKTKRLLTDLPAEGDFGVAVKQLIRDIVQRDTGAIAKSLDKVESLVKLAIPKAEEEAGGTMESYLVSGKCETVLEDLQAGLVPCYSFREVRRAAACLAWQKMESEKMPWGPSLKEAWQEVKQKCTWRE